MKCHKNFQISGLSLIANTVVDNLFLFSFKSLSTHGFTSYNHNKYLKNKMVC